MSLREITTPTVEPLTLAETKEHLRVTGSDDDSYIGGLIIAVRQYCENVTGRYFVERQVRWTLDSFPVCSRTALIIPAAPVQQIDSIVYTDIEGNQATWDALLYDFQYDIVFPRLAPAYGEGWPSDARDVMGAVKIDFTVGYDPSVSSPIDYTQNVPQAIKHAMRLVIGHFYENRLEVTRDGLVKMPLAADHLLSPYRIRGF